MTNKRSELANILRRLADYIDRHPDEELTPIFEQAARLKPTASSHKKNPPEKLSSEQITELALNLRELGSREAGELLLQNKVPTRRGLEALARFLQLPVQRDDTLDRLRAKIVENTIGSRLRSSAIQG